ncbi:MAG: metal-sensitive transcriptional regulator [Planctomycetota bacterium]
MARKPTKAKVPPEPLRDSKDTFKRTAAALDPSAKANNILQLRRAKGQVEGIERMIESDRYCADVILQITAARASLQAVAKDLLRRHLKVCHDAAAKNGGAAADEMYQELVDLVTKMAK